MRTTTLAVLALLFLAVPSSAQIDLELKKAFDDTLLDSFDDLVASYRELDAAGLLENQTIILLPPLRPGNPGDRDDRNRTTRATLAGEHVSDYLGGRLKAALPGSRVLYGADVENRFRSAGVSLSTYTSQAAGLALADDLRAGFIIAGTLVHVSRNRNTSFDVDLRGRRPGDREAADWTPSRVTVAFRGAGAYRTLDEDDQKPSQVPFGQDLRTRERDLSEAEKEELIEEWLEQSLSEAAVDFRSFIDAEASLGRIGPIDGGEVAVLPVGGGGVVNILGERVGYALMDAFESGGPDGLRERLDEAARQSESFDMTLGEVVAYGLQPAEFQRLGVDHLVRASCRTSRLKSTGRRLGGTLSLSLSVADSAGGFLSRTYRIEVGNGAPIVKEWVAEESEFAFERAELDAERVLRDELRALMPLALQTSGIDLEASSLRLLPLETPQTGSMLEAFGVVRGQLSRARADVADRADKANVAVEEAIKSKAFKVRIDVLDREFETYESARRTLMNLCWANLALSEPFALSNRLQEDYRVDVSKLAPGLQATPGNLVALDLELNQGRSTSSAATKEVDEFLLQDPDYVLTACWIPQGSRSSLIARVVDFNNPGTPVELERVELSRAKTEAIQSIMGKAQQFSGSEALKKMLGLDQSNGSGPAAFARDLVPGERDALTGVDLHIRYEGEVGKQLAVELSRELTSFPFDLERPLSKSTSAWSTLAPQMKSRVEIRWSGPDEDPAAEAAAKALEGLLKETGDGWLSSEVRFAAQRLSARAVEVSGKAAFLDVGPVKDRPTVLLLIRTL